VRVRSGEFHLSSRRRPPAFGTLLTVVAIVAATLASATPAHASVASDQAQITQLEKKIAADGQRVQSLVQKSNDIQARLDTLNAQIATDQKHLDSDIQQEQAQAAAARRVAVLAYVTRGGSDNSMLSLFESATTMTNVLAQSTYLNSVNANIDNALSALSIDQQRTKADQANLDSERSQAHTTLDKLASSKHDAQDAIASDNALLTNVKGDLKTLLAAAAARAAAQQKAEEESLARQRAGSGGGGGGGGPVPPAPVLPPASPGTYANPLRAVGGLNPERIDQGVDFSGFGPIYAIGDGVVLSTVNGGWPGGTFIAYRLTDGPANGLTVYFAEDIQPAVSVGQTVNANTVLGTVYAGGSGIELGWSDPSGDGDTMARDYHQYHGGNSTAFGFNFSQFLNYLGAPGGILQNDPPTGSLPGNWPSW
jgi:murein DD-endopeptidase MepM/ murein hydrolase activator NlpD